MCELHVMILSNSVCPYSWMETLNYSKKTNFGWKYTLVFFLCEYTCKYKIDDFSLVMLIQMI